ncbi:hypothetical protein L1887_36633 [Cichorium endivia]|nr:hypothetical protein L1887_36633 [Cichorium endivia]
MRELDGKFYGGNVMMMVNMGRFCAIGGGSGISVSVEEWFVTDLGVVYPRELISPHQKLITDDNISCVISTEILIIPENRK